MIRVVNSISIFAIASIAALVAAAPAWAACTHISSVADIEKMRVNPGGDYCLTGDIAFVRPFTPIDDFTGTLDGKGHALLGPENNLFNTLSGTVKNLRIVDAQLDKDDGFLFFVGNRLVGILAGDFESPGAIDNVSVSGTLDLTGAAEPLIAGGIVGLAGDGKITRSDGNVTILVSPDSTTSGYFGGIAGRVTAFDGATLSRSHAKGSIGVGSNVFEGGFVGSLEGKATVSASTAEVRIQGNDNNFAGGFAGFIGPGARIEDSSAFGSLNLGDGNVIGGFAGKNFGTVVTAVATGGAVAVGDNAIGGFIGDNQGAVSQSLATGLIDTLGDNYVGGFFGDTAGHADGCTALGAILGGDDESAAGAFSGATFAGARTEASYGVGHVKAGPPDVVGGFNGFLDPNGQIVDSFWTPETTGQAGSQGGAPLGVGRLLSRLPPGFSAPEWAQTKGVSLPYLNINFMGGYFHAQLGTVIKKALKQQQASIAAGGMSVYVFPPLGQFDATAYASPATHQDAASLGAVYAMLGRGIGTTDGIAKLQGVTIDTYFDDATQTARWTGPIKRHATLGRWMRIAPSEPIGESNIIGPIRGRQAVIVSGAYDNGDGRKSHYLLATSFTDKQDGTVTGLVADDPWTGQQVLIDPAGKGVIQPANYPLQGFTIARFRTVTLD